MALSIDLFESLNDSYPIDLSQFTNMCSASAQQPTTSLQNNASLLPTDLRIGSKVRISCNKPFPWLRKVSTTGSHDVIVPSAEMSMAMRLSMNGFAENPQIQQQMNLNSTPLAILQAATMFYQSAAPSSKPVFPRLEGTFSGKKATKSACENSLLTEWVESFSHLFTSWLADERDYFYACAYSFTALFTRALREDEAVKERRPDNSRTSHSTLPSPSPSSSSSPVDFDTVFNKKSNSGGSSDSCEWAQLSHRIVITPTTLGFREMLTAEGINFTLPLRNKSFMDYALEKGDQDFLSSKKRDEDDDDLDEDEWLKDIGISPKSTIKFRKTHSSIDFSASTFEELDMDETKPLSASVLHPNINLINFSANRKRKVSRLTSSQPPSAGQEDASRSTVVISEPTSIQSFYRLLLSHKTGVSKNGLHSGLAPTLIAPSPFMGAIPKKLKMSSQVTKKSNELKYILEIGDGPIMPFVTKLLAEFLIATFTKDETVRSEKGTAHVQILGQLPYAGFNEAVKTKLAANISEFYLDLSSRSFNF